MIETLIKLNFLNLCILCQRSEVEPMDCTSARRTQKADREKLRRDRLNEQFVALVNILGKSNFTIVGEKVVMNFLCLLLFLTY